MSKKNIQSFYTIIILLFIARNINAFAIVSYSPTYYNSNTAVMDTNLGISDYIIEDFADTTLISGLSIQYDNGSQLTSLPQVYDITTPLSLSNGEQFPNGMPDNAWDETHALVNNVNNEFDFPFVAKTTFYLSGGVDSFGIGLANFQTKNASHDLYVNNVKIADITSPNLSGYADGMAQNLYLIINAGTGEKINSVSFLESSSDTLVFDHLAVKSNIPEPLSLLLMGSTLLVLGLKRLK